jgi:Trypsin-like peptidase domain
MQRSVLLVGCWLFLQLALGQSTELAARQFTVLLETTIGETNLFGAGILLPVNNSTGSSYLIVTANHLVRQGLNDANRISVRPFFAPEMRFDAVLSPYYDVSLDLAVLELPDFSVSPSERLQVITEKLERRTPLEIIGNDGSDWHLLAEYAFLSRMNSQTLEFASAEIKEGDSGGGIFTADWRLLGMVRKAEDEINVGIPVSLILDKLEEWHYTVSFLEPTKPAEPPSSLQVSGYTQSGLCVNAGDMLEIEASGSIVVGSILGTASPDGIDVIFSQIYNLVPEFSHGALLCKLDSESLWRECGSHASFVVENQGCLEFQVNDNDQGNNRGAFGVQVVIGG